MKHVNLTIGFKGPKNGITPGSLDSVMVIGPRDKLCFSTYNQAMTMLVTLHKETFEEAEKIVRQEESSTFTNSNE